MVSKANWNHNEQPRVFSFQASTWVPRETYVEQIRGVIILISASCGSFNAGLPTK